MRRSRTTKGRQPDEESQTQARARSSLGCPAGEESADEWWRLAGGGAVQVDGHYATGRDGGGETGKKSERSGIDG